MISVDPIRGVREKILPVEVKERSSRRQMGWWGSHLKNCRKDAGKGRVEVEAAPESPHRSTPDGDGASRFVLPKKNLGD